MNLAVHEERTQFLLLSWKLVGRCHLVPKLRLSLHDRKLYQGSSKQVVNFVETKVVMIQGVKMTEAGVETEGDSRSLLSIYNGWVVLSKWNGTEHLLAKDGVHSHSVEIVTADFHVGRSEQNGGFVIQFVGD